MLPSDQGSSLDAHATQSWNRRSGSVQHTCAQREQGWHQRARESACQAASWHHTQAQRCRVVVHGTHSPRKSSVCSCVNLPSAGAIAFAPSSSMLVPARWRTGVQGDTIETAHMQHSHGTGGVGVYSTHARNESKGGTSERGSLPARLPAGTTRKHSAVGWWCTGLTHLASPASADESTCPARAPSPLLPPRQCWCLLGGAQESRATQSKQPTCTQGQDRRHVTLCIALAIADSSPMQTDAAWD